MGSKPKKPKEVEQPDPKVEAEKAANITVIELRAVGRFGRMFLSGTESEVQTARDAAVAALEAMPGREDRR